MKYLFAVSILLAGIGSGNARAAEEPEARQADPAARSLSITSLSCRALLQAGGGDRDLLLALLHGYVAGKAGKGELDTVKMSFVTDSVVDHCIDKPKDPVLAAFAAAETDAGR